MFQNLSEKFLSSIKKLKGEARISEDNIETTLKEIRFHLLEADVNFKVVKTFTERVKKKALGTEVLSHINPGQQFTQILHEELKQLLGGEEASLDLKSNPSIMFMVGLQGAGKTTSTAKLALHLRKKFKRKVGMFSVDVYRPAAIKQLQILAKQNNILFFESNPSQKPKAIFQSAKKWAQENDIEVLLVDTAGRLQVDEGLMAELKELKSVATPQEILLVVDAMLGQESVKVAEAFHKEVSISGLIMTKVDGDAKGGAALSIREALGLPIKFLGLGEKVSDFEVFYPDRLASRILDMGDVLSLVEKAQDIISEKEAMLSAKKMAKNQWSIDDFLKQMKMMKKMGGMGSILKMLPGAGQLTKQMKGMNPPDEEMKKIEAIIQSMTPKERRNHKILNASRRLRIAQGSGTEVRDLNRFLKQFEQSKKMMAQMMKGGMGNMMSMLKR
ncbi:MAG: signal recognition particle protein [Bdellovibrionaceae bacterium]|nr:signal recognition particle protein [Pseudobdellovibrionaceae bacterium]